MIADSLHPDLPDAAAADAATADADATSAAAALARLVSTLLLESHASHAGPDGPGARTEATGVAHAPAIAALDPQRHDHARLECALRAPLAAELTAAVHFVQVDGARGLPHERRLALPRVSLAVLVEGIEVDGVFGSVRVRLGARLRPLANGMAALSVRVDNTTPVPSAVARGFDRQQAMQHAMLSVHFVLQLSSGRFVLPAEVRPPVDPDARVLECRSVNTNPLLVGRDDRTLLGAAGVRAEPPAPAAWIARGGDAVPAPSPR